MVYPAKFLFMEKTMTQRHRYSTTAQTMILPKGSIGVQLKLTMTTLGNPVNGIGANYIYRISGILMYYDLINELCRHFYLLNDKYAY